MVLNMDDLLKYGEVKRAILGVRIQDLSQELADEKGIKAEIEKLTKELSELKLKIQITEKELEDYNKLKLEFEELLKVNENLNSQISKIQSFQHF